MKQHLIYKITNTLNGRFYIGMHTGFEDDGYFGSGKRLKSEVKKYGKENFKKEILEVCSDRKSLEQREAEIVNEELLIDSLCLNLKNGGDGGGKFSSEEHQLKCATAGGLANGSKVSWERHRDKLSKAVSNELKRRHSLGLVKYNNTLGMKFSDETKCKMSIAGSGINNSQFGTCWVTNGIKPIKIKKEFLDEYLNKGYSRGRKIFSA